MLRLVTAMQIRLARVWRLVRTPEPLTLHDLIGPKAYRITQPGKPFKARRTWERAMSIYINTRKVG